MAEQDLQTPTQFPTATRIENGTAYDVSGKALGQVKDPDDERPPQKTEEQDPFASLGATSAPAPKKDPFDVLGATAAPAPSITPAPAPSQDPKSVYDRFAGSFNQTLTGSENLNELYNKAHDFINSPDIGPSIPGMLPPKVGELAIQLALDAYQGQKHEVDAAKQKWSQPGIIPKAEGAVRYLQGAIPLAGPALGAIEDHFAKGEYAEGLGVATALLIPGATEKYGLKAVDSTVGRLAVSDTEKLIAANKTHESASKVFDQSMKEVDIATKQAEQASNKAEVTRAAEARGAATPQQRIDAENTASAAAANAKKAQLKLKEAGEARADARIQLDKYGRKIRQTLSKVSDKQTKAVAGATEDFKKMAPPTTSGPAAYTDRDLQIARGYLEQEHENEPIDSVQGHIDALQKISDDIDNKVLAKVGAYTNEPISTNVVMDVRDGLAGSSKNDFVERGMNALQKDYDITDLSMSEAQKVLTDLNADTRGILKRNQWDVATALRVDPEFAAKYYAANSIRNGMDGTLVDHDVTGVRELRQDQASVIKVKSAVERKATKGSQIIRGSGESGSIRKGLAKSAEAIGAMAGGGLGYMVGGPIGGEIGIPVGANMGRRVGRMISPGDITHDQLAARTMKVKGAGVPITEIQGTGLPSNPPSFPIPPRPGTAMSPADVARIQRENGPLHSALATHYGVFSGDTSYGELEQRFKDDIADKQRHGVALEGPENKLLGMLNQANDAEALAARQAAQEAALGEQKLPTATLPDEFEPAMQIRGRLQPGMDTQRGIVHDLAHTVVADELLGDKLPSLGIQSHLHPEVDGHNAAAAFDWSNFVDEDGNMDPKKVKNSLDDLATMFVAGGVANDLWHDIPFTENQHLGADLTILRRLMNRVGMSKAEQQLLVTRAGERAAEILSRPGYEEVLHDHAAVREPGLDSTMHFSPERIQQVLQDLKGGINAESTRMERPAGAREPGEPNGQRAKDAGGQGGAGQPKATTEEGVVGAVGQEREGPSQNKGKATEAEPGKRADVAESRNPALSTVTEPALSHRETERGGIVELGEGGKIGRLKYSLEGDTASLDAIEAQKGQGYGRKLLDEAMDQARARGAKTMVAGVKNTVSMDAAAMLDRAEAAGVPIEQIEGRIPGSPAYQIDLTERPQNPALAAPESPRQQRYQIDVTTNGETKTEPIEAFSRKQAFATAQKKFPQAQSFELAREEGEALPRQQGYVVPNEKHLNTPGSRRGDMPIERTMTHELGHYMVGHNEGVPTDGVYRHTHPEMPRGANAAVSWDVSGLKDARGKYKPEHIPGLMRMMMGGIAADEAFSDVPRAGNPNFDPKRGGDGGSATRILRMAGYQEPEITQMMHAAIDQAKEHLTQPAVSDIIKENAGVREPGLSRQFHYSPDRLRAMGEEAARRIQNEGPRNNRTIGGAVGEAGTANVAGREGQLAAEAGPRIQTAQVIPPERTTGSPEFDAAIKEGGGVPGGMLGTPQDKFHVRMFHDPQTGTTLGFAADEPVTAEATRAKIAESRKQYGIAPENPKLSSRVSTRVPEGKSATENPLAGEPLLIDRKAVEASPQKLQDRFADKVRAIPGVKIPKNISDNGKVFDRFIGHVADNLKFLYDMATPEEQEANAKWYESANKLTKDLADKHNFTHEQTAGTTAAMSPQMDWDANVSLAKRITDIYKNHANDTVTPEMIQKGQAVIKQSRKGADKKANSNLEKILPTLAGKKIGELTGFDRAAALRLYDETYNPRTFPRIDPGTGNEMELRANADGSPANVAWGNLNNISKALSILDDGSRENISNQVGSSHKVRNFYNNIIDPANDQDVTIDTHAVAAGLLQPLGGNAKAVLDNFGGAGKSMATGVKGTYPLYADAYRQAAKDLGLKPRELQSVVWEKIRNLFPAEWKTKENLGAVLNEWKKYQDGKQSLAKTRANIVALPEKK